MLSALNLEAGAVALLAMALLIGSFPDGFVERRWQRLALRCSWVILLGAPLALLASPVVPVSSDAAQYRPAIPNPYAVSWLAWLAEPAAWLALNYGWVLLVGVLVLCARFVAADAAGRAQLRVIFVVVLGLLLYFAGTVASALGAPEDSALVVTLYTLGSLTVILLPGAISYGILRHRLIDLDLVVRKSVAYGAAFLLIAATYAVTRCRRDERQSGARNPGRHRHHRCRARLPAAPPATRICRQQKAVRRPRTAVPATHESRHDDGADRRTRRAAASTRARGPRRNRCELGTGPAARRGW